MMTVQSRKLFCRQLEKATMSGSRERYVHNMLKYLKEEEKKDN